MKRSLTGRPLLPAPKKKKPRPIPCGTREGLEWHLRRREWPCGDCLFGSETYSATEIGTMARELRNKTRNQQLWKSYGISLTTYERILAEQGGCCACCSTNDPGESTWHVDHDHDTGLIRGILCSNCNSGIGMLGDNLNGLQHAVAYLQAHNTRGGHPRDLEPPKPLVVAPIKISESMQRCFDLFTQGASIATVVAIKRFTPELIRDIYALWKSRGGVVSPTNHHRFTVPRDPPQRVACSCGLDFPYTDVDSRLSAVEQLQAHLKKVDPALEAKITLMKLEVESNRQARKEAAEARTRVEEAERQYEEARSKRG